MSLTACLSSSARCTRTERERERTERRSSVSESLFVYKKRVSQCYCSGWRRWGLRATRSCTLTSQVIVHRDIFTFSLSLPLLLSYCSLSISPSLSLSPRYLHRIALFAISHDSSAKTGEKVTEVMNSLAVALYLDTIKQDEKHLQSTAGKSGGGSGTKGIAAHTKRQKQRQTYTQREERERKEEIEQQCRYGCSHNHGNV